MTSSRVIVRFPFISGPPLFLGPALGQCQGDVGLLGLNRRLAKYWSGNEGWGWHSWDPHYEPWEVVNGLAQPFEDAKIYTCGEAYSLEQGWAEGALRSAELVLKKLGLSPPKISLREYRALGFHDGYDEYIGAAPEFKGRTDGLSAGKKNKKIRRGKSPSLGSARRSTTRKK